MGAPKAAGTNLDKEASLLARRPASRPPLSLLEGGGVGRRLALAGRRLQTRCVMVAKQGGMEVVSRWVCPCCGREVQTALPDGHGSALDGLETAAAAALRGTRRPPRLAQLMESVECWTR